MIIVYDKNTSTDFSNYGLGKLKRVKSCTIIEELNGRYDVELTLYNDESKIEHIKKWNIIRADNQLFRITNVMQKSEDDTTVAFAKHIFYDLDYGFLEDTRAENKTITEALEICKPADFNYFTVLESDIEQTSTIYYVKDNGAQAVFSTLERYGGELLRDQLSYTIKSAIGRDNAVTFTYRKIDAIEVVENTDEVVTRLYPTGKEGVSLQEKYIYIPNWNEEEYLPFHITKEVKFEAAENEGDLRILAQKAAEEIGLASKTFKIDVHDLLKSELYANLTSLLDVNCGDIVTIKHAKLNIRIKSKVVRIERELISNKTKLELGTLSDKLSNILGGGSGTVTFPDTTNLRNELFYYFNGAEIKFNKLKAVQLASMRVATSVQTNLMCHISLNPFVEEIGTLLLRITVNNEEIQFSPIIDLNLGYSIQTISVPLIAIDGGQTQIVKIWAEFDGTGILEANRIHFSITGQNVAMGLIKIEPFTGAYIEYVGKLPLAQDIQVPTATSMIDISVTNQTINPSEFSIQQIKKLPLAQDIQVPTIKEDIYE